MKRQSILVGADPCRHPLWVGYNLSGSRNLLVPVDSSFEALNCHRVGVSHGARFINRTHDSTVVATHSVLSLLDRILSLRFCRFAAAAAAATQTAVFEHCGSLNPPDDLDWANIQRPNHDAKSIGVFAPCHSRGYKCERI